MYSQAWQTENVTPMNNSTTQRAGEPGIRPLRKQEIDRCDELLTVGDVAELLRVPVSWVYGRTRRRDFGRLPHLKLGKYLRFSQQEVLNWLERMRGI